MTNTSRTLKYLRDDGWEAGMVERFLSFAGKHGRRVDLFNIIDIIAMDNWNILGVQSCGKSFSEHNRKILASPMAIMWLECGGLLWLVGWRKLKLKRGGKAMRWRPRVKKYELKEFTREVR